MIVIEDHGRAFPCGTMNSVIVGELCKRQPVAPVGLLMIYKDAKVLFDFLVYLVWFVHWFVGERPWMHLA